ncbi:MAG: hypothetical protein PHO15_02630 [Eubacteriales bacterium]|nr:hypothetical protein [Eubacteriales bacterium]
MAIGSLIIKEKFGLSDIEVVELYEQQKGMYEAKIHQVDNRIVSIHRAFADHLRGTNSHDCTYNKPLETDEVFFTTILSINIKAIWRLIFDETGVPLQMTS